MRLFDRLNQKIRKSYVQVLGEQATWADPQAYRNATVREAVDAIARHAAKLKARHMADGNPVRDEIERILQIRPNPVMNSYDMIYKLVTQTMLKNNGFLYLDWKRNYLAGVYPVDYSTVIVEEDPDSGALTMHFTLLSGKEFWADYGNIIHLRRFYGERPVLGSDNQPMNDAVGIVNASNAGTISAIKSGTTLRGLLKVTKKALAPSEVKKRREEFLNDYANPDDGSGVAALDADMEYTQLDPSKLYTVKAEERKQIKDEVYSYFGINEKIVRSSYNEDEWNAFYESMLEPIAVQLSLEMTAKLFTRREQLAGHEIVFEANRLQYASAKTKIELVNTLGMLGIIQENEGREIFNMPKLPGGDKLIENWNHTSSGTNNQTGGTK